MSDTMSDAVSDAVSDISSDETPDDLQQLWKEALEQCEQVERVYADILRDTTHLQQSLSTEIEDGIIVTYQGIQQDLMDILHSIHTISLENNESHLGSMLLNMLESCEFKTSA
jgi:hypothetical protein